MSKVGFQAELYGLNQTMPRSGATNDDCLIRIMAIWKGQGGDGYVYLVLFVSWKPTTLKIIEKLSPSCKRKIIKKSSKNIKKKCNIGYLN